MTDSITNEADYIDSRDIIARIEDLTERADDPDQINPLDEDEQNELRILRELADEANGYAPDWEFGETLIRESYFEEYAEQLAEDIGAIDRNAGWPLGCIDWEKAADQLKIDYTSVEFDGVTYWVR
jgi:hypothetical protein